MLVLNLDKFFELLEQKNLIILAISVFMSIATGSGNPVRSEEHQEEPWGKKLALVEALYHSAASDSGPTH